MTVILRTTRYDSHTGNSVFELPRRLASYFMALRVHCKNLPITANT